MSNKIFVQIASYRDPELIPTVLDLFKTAKFPSNINVSIAWQHDDFESISPIKHLVDVIDIPYPESRGVCWARNVLQKKYDGEKYALQLDSHHRFVPGWDVELINMYKKCISTGSSKPIITTYLPNFYPESNKFNKDIWSIEPDKFMDDGPLFLTPKPMVGFKTPKSARFFSGHFAFSSGEFVENVKYDPDYYFYGEEISISARSYTHGYDMFHPHKIIGWHRYSRSYRPTHWVDYINHGDKSWKSLDSMSTKKHRVEFGMEPGKKSKVGSQYGFGNIRSLRSYEKFAGIRFKDRTIIDSQ